jgi:hypothetical protein
VLDVVFVRCAVCAPNSSFPTLFPKYLDVIRYQVIIQSLRFIFQCTPSILEKQKPSLPTLKIRRVVRVRDMEEIFFTQALPNANVMILKSGVLGSRGVATAIIVRL